jgi:hypothetical protein
MDFHCNGDNDIEYDVRIRASGGGTTTGTGSLSIYANSLEITCPISISSTIPGADTMLGWTTTQVNTAQPVTFNTWTVVEPHLISTAGTYLLSWAVQREVSTSVTYLTTNIAYGSNAATTTPLVTPYTNWGSTATDVSTPNIFYEGSSGSTVVVAPANTYYNLCVYVTSGGGNILTCKTWYQITRIG